MAFESILSQQHDHHWCILMYWCLILATTTITTKLKPTQQPWQQQPQPPPGHHNDQIHHNITQARCRRQWLTPPPRNRGIFSFFFIFSFFRSLTFFKKNVFRVKQQWPRWWWEPQRLPAPAPLRAHSVVDWNGPKVPVIRKDLFNATHSLRPGISVPHGLA